MRISPFLPFPSSLLPVLPPSLASCLLASCGLVESCGCSPVSGLASGGSWVVSARLLRCLLLAGPLPGGGWSDVLKLLPGVLWGSCFCPAGGVGGFRDFVSLSRVSPCYKQVTAEYLTHILGIFKLNRTAGCEFLKALVVFPPLPLSAFLFPPSLLFSLPLLWSFGVLAFGWAAAWPEFWWGRSACCLALGWALAFAPLCCSLSLCSLPALLPSRPSLLPGPLGFWCLAGLPPGLWVVGGAGFRWPFILPFVFL